MVLAEGADITQQGIHPSAQLLDAFLRANAGGAAATMTGQVAQSDSWRLHALTHGLLIAGAATDVGFTLTFSHSFAPPFP